MDIQETFLNLTSFTYPHGTEHELFQYLPRNYQLDEFGNPYLLIGESPKYMFTCHLDTASYSKEKVNHFIQGEEIMTDGKTILGADDKAGMTILLYMIEKNIPGLYYFFLGEERGCIGSRKVASKHKTDNPFPTILAVVSFDRRGTSSIITHQLGGRCCSDLFATELAKELNLVNPSFDYTKDPTGIYTDSAQFTEIYPECTNVSVGYDMEHTTAESINIVHLKKLCEAATQISWDKIPIERNPRSKEEYDQYEDDQDEDITFTTKKVKDTDYPEETIEFTINNITKEVYITEISNSRKIYELNLIKNILKELNIEYTNIEWDGNEATLSSDQTVDYIDRDTLQEYISELNLEEKYKYIYHDVT